MDSATENRHDQLNRDHEHVHGHEHARDHPHPETLWGKFTHALTPHSHDHADMISDSAEATRVATRAAWISLIGMAATAVLQIGIVAISGSIGLLADTIHNLGHLITTIPLIIAFKMSQRPASRRFTYGLRRAEDLVGLFIGLVIATSAVLIFVDAFQALRSPRPINNLGWVLTAALIGALGNELVAQYRIRAGNKVGSAALIAEGHHARTDAMTSIAVVFGVIGAWFGNPRIDALVGLFIGIMVIGVLMSSMKSVLTRLLDGVDSDIVDKVEHVASHRVGAECISNVRARWAGHDLTVELDARLPQVASIQELGALEYQLFHDFKAELPRLEELRLHPIQ